MRFLSAIAMLTAVLLARAPAHAAADRGDPLPTARILVERCAEQPMSLALQIAEAEAARSLTARSLSSLDEPVNATPAPRVVAIRAAAPAKPFTPTPHACTSPGEAGCEVSSPFQTPGHVEIAHVVHDGAVCVIVPEIPPPGCVPFEPAAARHVAPSDAHARSPWRPPAC